MNSKISPNHFHFDALSAPVHIEEMKPNTTQIVLYNDKDFELSCTASGSNINKVTWYKDDEPLDNKYFQIKALESVEGIFEYGQPQAVRNVVGTKVKYFVGEHHHQYYL